MEQGDDEDTKKEVKLKDDEYARKGMEMKRRRRDWRVTEKGNRARGNGGRGSEEGTGDEAKGGQTR